MKSEMARLAIGAFNGWKCPQCKRIVKSPQPLNMGHDVAEGQCKFCGTPLIFKRVKVFTPPSADEITLAELTAPIETGNKPPIDVKEVFEKYYEAMFEKYILPKIISDNGRWVWVNFLNRPVFLKRCEAYAKEHGLLLSEVIIGLAAKGFKDLFMKETK